MPIALENVSYAYQTGTPFEVAALSDVSLRVEDGECVGVMGRTGCGKTTLLQIIAGLLPPSNGRVYVDGDDINAAGYDRRRLRESVGMVFQYPEYQLFETTVEKDVAFGLKHSRLSASEVEARVKWALETLGFSFAAIRRQSPLALSGGEKRRVAMAGVLVSRPKFLIFDEPIAGLDPLARDAFLRMTARLRDQGRTILMVSHNADAIGECAERLVVFEEGRVVMDGTVRQVFADLPRLRALGLDASAPRVVADKLAARGMAMPQDIVRYDELIHALQHTLTKGVGG